MPPCCSVAFYDRNLGYLHLEMVAICHFVIVRPFCDQNAARLGIGMVAICWRATAWQIATKSPNATPREILQYDKAAFAEARC